MRIFYKYALIICSVLLTSSAIGKNVASSIQPDAHNKKFYIRTNIILPTYRRFNGKNNYDVDFDLGLQAAGGWNFHKHASVEIEGNYFQFPIKNTSISLGDYRTVESWSGFINLVCHPNLVTYAKLQPFIGVGGGYTKNTVGVETNISGDKIMPANSSKAFAYQAFIGIECVIRPHLSLVIDLRWVDLGTGFIQLVPKPMKSGRLGISNRLTTQTLNLGLKYKF